MEFQLFSIITLFSVLIVASHETQAPEAYWNSVLPETAMPKAIKDLIKPGTTMGEKGGSGGSISFFDDLPASAMQLHDSETRTIFLFEKDLKLGKSMKLDFTKKDGDATFLARWDAEKIPFSSEKMSDIFRLYNVKAGSEEGQIMTLMVNECEKPATKGEEKYCATSLESMVDFSTSKLGKNVHAISTEVDKGTKLQEYTITGLSKMKSNEAVVCHKQPYPYAIFYCHHTHAKRAYRVSLVGTDGTKATAVAICHTDTSAWNPKHLAFQVLKVQPGTVPVCHYLPEDHIVWVANKYQVMGT